METTTSFIRIEREIAEEAEKSEKKREAAKAEKKESEAAHETEDSQSYTSGSTLTRELRTAAPKLWKIAEEKDNEAAAFKASCKYII